MPTTKTRKNVLLVEDDPAMRLLIREILEDHFEVDETDNGEDGITKGTGHLADLVILDYHLPRKDGLEVIAAIREKHPELPVIVLTGFLNPESEAKFNRLGANYVFPKPFNYKILLDSARKLAARSASPTTLPKPIARKAGSLPEEAMLTESLSALASLAEKVEYLSSVTEKYWIEPDDIAAMRETARCMQAELRRYYGLLNQQVFESGSYTAPVLRKAAKPCVSGAN